jgi:TonB dependent receptor/Carboxypeptidase regulatory-like domain/TonB-dependent Receptor Plug Domain
MSHALKAASIMVCTLGALLLSCSITFAQSAGATISGRITDQTGGLLVGVQVTVTSADTGISVSTLTNDEGVYVLQNIRPGAFRMSIEKHGFKTIVLSELILAVQDVLSRNFPMELASGTESITVTGEEHNLSPAVSTVVNQQFVENMPLNGRSFQSLIQLTPGVVVTAAGQGMEGQFSVNGQRTNTNYFTVDGLSVNFSSTISVLLGQSFGGTLPALTIGGGTNAFVSVDAMQEFRIQTSTYSPEFGRSPGAQIAIVTKSGTNRFHGTAYDYLRNDVFDARNWFDVPPLTKPPLRQNDFGGTLGGPILKDRTFFFFSYEGLRLSQPQTASGDFYVKGARAAVASVYQPLVDAEPLPNGPILDPSCDNITTPCVASLTAAYSNPSSFDAYSLRLDHTLNQRVTLFARVSHTPSTQVFRNFSDVQYDTLNTDLVSAGATATLSPTSLNDFRFGWSRSSGKVVSTLDSSYGTVVPPDSAIYQPGGKPSDTQPTILFPDADQALQVGTRTANVQRQLEFLDTFSMATGTHQLKFGADFRRLAPTNQVNGGYGLYLTNFSQLVAGTMGEVVSIGADPISARSQNWSAFAEDLWTVGPRLTLTYGFRWEINTPPVSTTPGKPLYAIEGVFDAGPLQLAPAGTPLWHTRYDNFAPRFGAAYQLAPRAVLRGGFGLFYDLGYGGQLGQLIFGFPYERVSVVSALGQPFDLNSPVFLPPPFSTSLSTNKYANLAAFDPNLQLPLTWQWNAAFEYALGANQSLSVTYVGADGQRLLRPDVIVPPGSGLVGGTSDLSATRNAGYSHYNALQVQFQRRMSRGLQALASYTLAKSSDTVSDDQGGNNTGALLNASTAASVSQIQLPPLAPSDFDIRHVFSAAVSYEIPSPSWGKVGDALLENWAFDGIVRASSSPPLNVRIEGESPALGIYATQPDLVPGQSIWLSAPGQPGGKILNPDAFTLPPIDELGDFPRNSIRSPFGISQTDVALRRRFRLTERIVLDFRVEYFNLFNHPMFGGPYAPYTFWGLCATTPCTGQQNGLFGKATPGPGALNQGLGGGGLNGGQSAIYALGGPRSGQFSLKLSF